MFLLKPKYLKSDTAFLEYTHQNEIMKYLKKIFYCTCCFNYEVCISHLFVCLFVVIVDDVGYQFLF